MTRFRPFLPGKFREERGFTLMETILTLAILAVLVGIVLSALRVGTRSWERGEAAMENAAANRTLTSKLSAEISSAYPYKQNNNGEETVLFRGGAKTLGFVTVSGQGLPGLPWGGAKWVYYSVRNGKLTVREKTVPCEGAERDEGGRLVELEEGVAWVDFEYLGGEGWQGGWGTDDKTGLPLAIKVTISFNDGRRGITETVLLGLTHEGEKNRAS